jgi:hypothetical protein
MIADLERQIAAFDGDAAQVKVTCQPALSA